MVQKDKLREIIIQSIKQRMGKDPSKEEIAEYLKKLSPMEMVELLLNIDDDMTDDDRKAMLEADEEYRDEDSDEEWNGEEEDDWFYGSGKLECMPALNVKKYTLRIKLRGISPSIWRKIEVPSNVKLTSLAEIIITAMGWQNEHLHQFVTKGRTEHYTTAKKDDDDDFWSGRQLWGGDYTIGHLLKAEKEKVTFEYDFGDGWEHDVTLSKVEEYADDESHTVKLISGKRACPPEDCGGVWGYSDLCEAMKHPYSKHAKELKEWLGYKFDPEEFWLEDVREEVWEFNE